MLCERCAIVSTYKYRCFPGWLCPLPAVAAAAEASGRPPWKSTIVLAGMFIHLRVQIRQLVWATIVGELTAPSFMNLCLFSEE